MILKRNNENKMFNSGFLIVLLLFITMFSIVSKNIFYQYTNYALYFNMLISIGGFMFLKDVNKATLIFVSLVAVYLLISILITGGGIGSVITFIVPFFLYIYISKAVLTEYQVNFIRLMSFAILLYEFYFSFRYAENYIFYALSDVNPNTVGMYLMFSFMIWSSLSNLTTKFNRIVFCIGLAISFLGMYNCQSRGTSFALLSYVLLLLVPIKMLSQRKIMFLVIAIVVIGTAFPFIYIMLYQNNVNFELFGKTLYTGREGIWINMFDAMNDNFLAQVFGLGSKIELWEEHSLNVHNNYFNIIVNFGIIGFVLYFLFVIKTLIDITRHYKDRMTYKLCAMFISSVLLLGLSETTSLWSVIFIFSYISLSLAYKQSSMLALKSQE